MFTVPSWYCCLSAAERAILAAMIELEVLSLYVGVPLAVYDALWVPVVKSQAARRAAFLSIYELGIVTITTPEGEPVEVVAPTYLPFWVEAAAWILQPAAACPSGCEQVNYG